MSTKYITNQKTKQ